MSEREELEADEAGQCANCGGRLVFEESRAHGRCAWCRPWLQNGSQPHQEEGVYIYEIGGKLREIDAEIFPLVKALNEGGIGTIASCSGHGNKPGSVCLADGREIILARSHAEARAIEQLFPDIHGERKWGDAEHERLEAQLMLLIHNLNWSDGTPDATQTLVAANIRHAVHKLVEDGALVSVDQVDARVDEAVRAIEAIKATRDAATKGNGELVEAAIAVICEWDDLNSPDVDCTGFGGGAPEPDSPAMARLRKALSDSEEAGPSGDGWQPIETAPKDGTEIVARDAATGTSHVTYWTLDWHDPDNHHYSEAPGFSPHPLDAPPRPASSPRASWRWRQG